MTVLEKQPSPELLSLMKAAAQSLLGFGELWNSIKKKGKDEGFSEKELQDILRPLLKPQLNKDQIYYLFNADQRKENAKEQHRRYMTTNDAKKDIELRDIPEQLPPDAPTKTSEQFYNEQDSLLERNNKINEITAQEEEPTELELANIKIAQLEDALHKTEQFKPAIQITPGEEFKVELNDGVVFEWLRKRDNGINIYFFDNYGRELFSNRILSQLRNSGVKTFKRLYFEI